jgi:DnaK suppressor protein
MTNTERMNLKAALKAKQLEIAAQLRGRVKELTIEDSQPELVDWIQRMTDRDETAGMLDRFSSTLTEIERSLRAMREDRYGVCMGCGRPIAVKRLQSIPWAANCVRCQEQLEAGGAVGDGWELNEDEAA